MAIEIELLVENEDEADEADARIIEYAASHGLETGVVILGKVAAFLKSEALDHYDRLVNAGVLK